MVARDGRQIQSMIRLIDDMLDVSRIRSGVLSIRPCDTELRDILQRLTSDLARQAADAGTHFELEAPEPVKGCWDEFRIEQVIINLLTNAMRYGGGQPVDIVVEGSAGEVRIDVIDTGMGISAADQKRIFEPFERGSGSGEVKGLGLGLAISRQLAQAHGGQLGVISDGQTGSIFSLTLPLVAASAHDAADALRDEAASYRAP
jgi:signal transduction histidine kinase